MECNSGNVIASLPQSWDWLENRKGKNDKVSKGVWKIVEAKAGKTVVAKIKRREEKREKRKEMRRNRAEKKKKKPKKDRIIEVKKIVEEWEIWNKEKAVKFEEETKGLVS